MLSKQDMSKRAQIGFFSLEDLVPQDHLLRQIDQCIDFSFIYELVKEKYDEIQGRPSLDPILLIKLPMIQYLFGIKSMRQTIKENRSEYRLSLVFRFEFRRSCSSFFNIW